MAQIHDPAVADIHNALDRLQNSSPTKRTRARAHGYDRLLEVDSVQAKQKYGAVFLYINWAGARADERPEGSVFVPITAFDHPLYAKCRRTSAPIFASVASELGIGPDTDVVLMDGNGESSCCIYALPLV